MAHSPIKVHTEHRLRPLASSHPLTHRVLESFRSELDEAFARFSRHFGLPSLHGLFDFRAPLGSIAAATDMVEEEKLYRVSVELPGIEPTSIDVTVSDNTLAIKAEKKEGKEKEAKNYYLYEREYGSFERSIGLPAGVDPNEIGAEFANGVLTMVLPKSAEAAKRQKKISVKTE